MLFISFLSVSVINLCCLTVDSPLNSVVSTNISYIEPQPPEMSLTVIFLANGNLDWSAFCSSSSEFVIRREVPDHTCVSI